MKPGSPSMLKATLIGGSAAGVLSSLPLVGALNCLCCSLIVGGGFFAAYLYAQSCRSHGVEFRPGTGALVGLVAAFFYAIASTIVGMIFRPDVDEVMSQMESMGQNVPPEVLDWVTWFLKIVGTPLGALLAFGFSLILGAIFSTLGGLIGGAAFKVEAQPGTPGMGPTGA